MPEARRPRPARSGTYEGETATLNVARHDVDEWLEAAGIGDAIRRSVALVVSELATNAVQAAPAHAYDVHVEFTTDSSIAIRVRNDIVTTTVPERADWHPVDQLAARGRGLSVVDHLADSVDVDESDADTVTVTALMRVVGA